MKQKKYNNSSYYLIGASLAVSLLGGAACQRLPNNDNEIKAEQFQELVSKIDLLNQKVDRLSRPGNAARNGPKRPSPSQLYKVPVAAHDGYRGGEHAKVTLVVATEHACPYCAKLETITDKLLADYQDEELKIVSKPFIVHPSTATAPALASCAAKAQGKFAEFEKEVWNKAWHAGPSLALSSEALSSSSLDAIATSLKLDLDRFHKDMAGTCSQTLVSTRKELSALGVGGTPAMYVNGMYYTGPRSVEALKALVDAEIEKADQVLAKGMPLERYYQSVIAKGKSTI